MKYILDTNVVSALIEADPRPIERLARLGRDRVAVPQPVFAEIAYGIARLPKSKRKEALRDRFELVRSELKVADWSEEVTDAFGEIKAELERAGQRIEDFDAAIAAHALANGAVLVTANVKHMGRISRLSLENWL
jgi:tRNA(fMet)-specific endonuclease VapC